MKLKVKKQCNANKRKYNLFLVKLETETEN